MTKFTALLAPENIRQGIICSSKKTALEMIGRLVAETINAKLSSSPSPHIEQMEQEETIQLIDEFECFEHLFAREKMGCTAIGNGIAIPRARLPENVRWDRPIAMFLQLANAIEYEATDKREVDLLFAIMLPKNLCQEYSTILAELSERLKDKSLGKQLRNAQSAEEIWQIFEYADAYVTEENSPDT